MQVFGVDYNHVLETVESSEINKIFKDPQKDFLYSNEFYINYSKERYEHVKKALISTMNEKIQIDKEFKSKCPSNEYVFNGCGIYNSTMIIWRLGLHLTTLRCSFLGETQEIEEFCVQLEQKLKDTAKYDQPELVDLNACWFSRDVAHEQCVSIDCPEWNTIDINYSNETKSNIIDLLELLHDDPTTNDYGKLLIFYGITGSGKTWMIRSLMRRLKEHYKFLLITDSHNFMLDTSYYYGLISNHSDPVLFILEDSAKGLLKESRRTHGEHISKILNLTDGLIGQGRKDKFLVTFNEDIPELDEAIVRPGRCIKNIEFSTFNKSEALQWADNHGISLNSDKDVFTLAELYNQLKNGKSGGSAKLKPPKKSVGFKLMKELR